MSNHCEKAMAAMATGGPFRRWWAMRHAARCRRCAAVRDELRQFAEALAEVAPLTAVQRRLWAAAATDEFTAEPARAWRFQPVLAGALAALILIAVGAWWASRPQKLRLASQDLTSVEPSTAKQETLREMEGLRGDLVTLAQELDGLRRRAELLEARKDVEALIARLAPQGHSSGL